jgi:uncharacterized protein (TIGR02118 family)
MIKMIALLTRKDGESHGDFVAHWTQTHGPLAHGIPGLRRYVQSHIVSEQTRADIPTTQVDVDGIAELWFDDEAALHRAHNSPQMQALLADGALFIGGIKTFFVEEREIVAATEQGVA